LQIANLPHTKACRQYPKIQKSGEFGFCPARLRTAAV
jgi:hypothetical protein